MKKFNILMCILAIGLFAACQNDPEADKGTTTLPRGTTHMTFSLILPQGTTPLSPSRAFMNTYDGVSAINTVDVYLFSADGQSVVYAHRYRNEASEINFVDNTITMVEPFATTPGDRRLMVVVNCPHALMNTPPNGDYVYTISSALPLTSLAKIDTTRSIDVTGYGTVYGDVVTISGMYTGTIKVIDNVTKEEVIAENQNSFSVNVVRVASRAVVTAADLNPTVTRTDGVVLGTVSDIRWSMGQGSNQVYLLHHDVPGLSGVTETPGYDYIPGLDYDATAPNWYDYTDLTDTTTTVPLRPADDYVDYLPGKFFLENTHEAGADPATSSYRMGNTAYALIRVKFTPAADQIVDGGALAGDGSFYVGATDGHIYSSVAAAQAATTGQKVLTYIAGKMLYTVWLNPDSVEDPVNSPTERNSIYRVNIRSFKSMGNNWNPLNPSTDNPDPRPGDPNDPDNPEPDDPLIPIHPTDPLSSTDTYMTVDAEVVPWNVYSYDLDL